MAGLCVNQSGVFTRGFSNGGSATHGFSSASVFRGAGGARGAPNSPLGFGGAVALEARPSAKCRACRQGRAAKLDDYEYNLYELLGLDKEARAEDIKRAYRWLQKRCHPDVAGSGGHDMSILLNDAYSVLSDPDRRASYDAVCAENETFAGFTGNPLYSKWFGMPRESRAVFVEETRCIGCLQCALIAPNTFSIESKHGRARACNQWLDEEHTIKDAIRACPVDCISWVSRDLLPALEFIMSKQPRLPTASNHYGYVGVRQENVFASAGRFSKKFAKREELKTSTVRETDAQREARMAAAEGIRIKSGRWWYDLTGFPNLTFANLWDPATTRISQGALVPLSSTPNNQFVDTKRRSSLDDADLRPLFEAAASLRGRAGKGSKSRGPRDEEYWTPIEPLSCPIPLRAAEKADPAADPKWEFDTAVEWPPNVTKRAMPARVEQLVSAVPIAIAVGAAVLVGMSGGGSGVALSESVVSGPLPASITSGVAMHMFLTAVVWYMIAAVVCTGGTLLATALVSSSHEPKSPDH